MQLKQAREVAQCQSVPMRRPRRVVEAAFDGGDIVSDGGAPLLQLVDARIGLTRAAARVFSDGRRAASVRHTSAPGPPLVLPAGARVCRIGLSPMDQPRLGKTHPTTRPSARCAPSSSIARSPGRPARVAATSSSPAASPRWRPAGARAATCGNSSIRLSRPGSTTPSRPACCHQPRPPRVEAPPRSTSGRCRHARRLRCYVSGLSCHPRE